MSAGNDPSTISSLHPTQGLDLRFRTFKNAERVQGSHYLALKQPSRTPESSREYVAGDPTNLIDWKAYARTDQLLIREVRDEASARIAIAMDLSESTNWPAGPMGKAGVTLPTKREVILRIGFHLAHAFMRLGDLVELQVITSDKQVSPELRFVPRSPSDLIGVFEETLEQIELPKTFEEIPDSMRRRDIVFWVGDCLSSGDFLDFCQSGKRSFLLHVLSSLELDIDWIDSESTYFDDARQLREYRGLVLRSGDSYKDQLAKWTERIRQKLNTQGGDYFLMTEETGINRYLTFLNSAARMRE